MKTEKILVVEDDMVMAIHIKKMLKKMGFKVVGIALSGDEAIEKAGALKPDLMLMDIVLKGDMDGIEAASEIQNLYDIPVVYLTAYLDDKTYERAKLTKPYGFLTKPIKKNVFRVTVETAIYKHDIDKQLAENEKLYKLILDTASSGVFFADSNNRIKYLNQNMADALGYSTEEILNTSITMFMDAKSKNSFKYMNEWKKGKNRVNEFHLVRKDGSTFWALISASPVKDANGKYSGVIGVITDINARKAFEMALVEQERRSEAALYRFNRILNDLIRKTESEDEIFNYDFENT